jgi:hypothetical protein
MNRNSMCRCLICGLESSLVEQLAEEASRDHYRQFADSNSLLANFPDIPDLLAYLHTSRTTDNDNFSADGILATLLRTQAAGGGAGILRDFLLLAFIPALHSTCRQVASRNPSIPAADIAQHSVAALLQIFGLHEFYGRTSHVAFAISRNLKRNTFKWAERECRSPTCMAAPEPLVEIPATHEATDAVERAALLPHFLSRCQQRGLVTSEDLELLVQCKPDAARDSLPDSPAGVYSNASRQRMKRLLRKLRSIARTPRNGKPDSRAMPWF